MALGQRPGFGRLHEVKTADQERYVIATEHSETITLNMEN
jgi:hypothetical protein